MFRRLSLRHFISDQDGAVTVDWVVLTASITVIVIATTPIVISAVFTAASSISDDVTTAGSQ